MSTHEKISRRTWLKGMAACSAAAGMPLIVGSPRAEAPTFEILPPIEKDLVADFGGSLPAWNAYFATTTGLVRLAIPPGTYGTFAQGEAIAVGGKSAIIDGAGAAVTHLQIGQTFALSENGAPAARGPQWPSFATAHIGDTSITLLDLDAHHLGPWREERFTGPGQWVVLMCFDMMGYGYPQNNYYFEINRIVDLDRKTGVCTLEYPLRHEYVDHYPTWSVGDDYHPDEGGRATIMSFGSWWDAEITVKNISILNDYDHVYFGTCAQRGVGGLRVRRVLASAIVLQEFDSQAL